MSEPVGKRKLLKRDSGAGIFMWVLWNFYKSFSLRALPGECFCLAFVENIFYLNFTFYEMFLYIDIYLQIDLFIYKTVSLFV